MKLLAISGPTAVGKTGVAIAIAERLREHGEKPVAVNCDALQVYRGIEVLTGAARPEERDRLEHRLLGIADVDDEFSAGRFAELARREIDSLLDAGRRPIVVGGTGLYMRAALADIELRPPVDPEVRAAVENDIDRRGPEALHHELVPGVAAGTHPRDRKRVARALELQRAGLDPPPPGGGELWTASLRHPTLMVGITIDRDELDRRIEARVDVMVAAGAADEARRADAAGATRTVRAAIGFEELLAGDVAAMTREQRRYARRQLTWIRKTPQLRLVDRTGRDDADVAREIVSLLL